METAICSQSFYNIIEIVKLNVYWMMENGS